MFKKIITKLKSMFKSEFQYTIYTGCGKKKYSKQNGKQDITEEEITKFELAIAMDKPKQNREENVNSIMNQQYNFKWPTFKK